MDSITIPRNIRINFCAVSAFSLFFTYLPEIHSFYLKLCINVTLLFMLLPQSFSLMTVIKRINSDMRKTKRIMISENAMNPPIIIRYHFEINASIVHDLSFE